MLPAAMASIDDLPSDVVKLVLTQIMGPLQLKSDADTFGSLKTRCKLASVCRRWRAMLLELPISVTVMCNSAADSRSCWSSTTGISALGRRIFQIAGCPAPVSALYIRMLPRMESFPTAKAETPYEVGRALAAVSGDGEFRRRSGRNLRTVALVDAGPPAWGLECSEPLDAFTALTQLTGMCGHLPRLPACLEILQWNAAASSIDLDAAPDFAVLQARLQQLPNLKHLSVSYAGLFDGHRAAHAAELTARRMHKLLAEKRGGSGLQA